MVISLLSFAQIPFSAETLKTLYVPDNFHTSLESRHEEDGKMYLFHRSPVLLLDLIRVISIALSVYGSATFVDV